MSRRYDPSFKTEILRQLDANGGNVALTVLHTGVPRRTLYYWKRQRDLVQKMPQQPVLPQVQSLIDEKDDDSIEDVQEICPIFNATSSRPCDPPSTAHLSTSASQPSRCWLTAS